MKPVILPSTHTQNYKMTSIFEILHTRETMRTEEEIAQQANKKNTTKGEQKGLGTRRCFLICQRCFWCASFIDGWGDSQNFFAKTCPTCNDHNIESLPLLYNERYHFDYTVPRGVVLEFLR